VGIYRAQLCRADVALLRRTRWKVPLVDLTLGFRDPFEVYFRVARMVAKTFFDGSGRVLPAWIKIAKVVDEAWLLDGLHVLAARMKGRLGRIATRDHERHVELICDLEDGARESILFEPNFDIGTGIAPKGLTVRR